MQRLRGMSEGEEAVASRAHANGAVLAVADPSPLATRPEDAVLEHDVAVMMAALVPHLSPDTLASAKGLIYRQCFIKLFNHLENIGRLLASHQVAASGLDGLEYWLARIASY